ncbi:MAG: hypothetical protein K5673_04325, partial [Lachnospiraceae bacterium]|nr:hypothetical protein [Lachnospiraceae bacterium]
MKSKNIPKCIREGIFCMMTGAMVFAGSTMVVEAEENETSMDAGTPETTGPDTAGNENSSNGGDTDASAAAAIATDENYGDVQGTQDIPDVVTPYSTTSESVTTYTEVIDDATNTTSETTVDYKETTYDVTNTDYYEAKPTDGFQQSVADGDVTEKYAVVLDANGNVQLDADGNPVKVPVSSIPSMNIDEGGYFYFIEDGDDNPDPYYTNETTTETTVTTDSKEVAEAIKTDIEKEMADQNGVDGTDADGNPTNTVTETDARFGTTKKTITLSVSDIVTTSYINT